MIIEPTESHSYTQEYPTGIRIPYFYIIQNIITLEFYAGAKWAKDANPNTFLVPGGYTTSSNYVNKVNEQHGCHYFRIIQLLTEAECGIDVYEYETMYLQKYNISKRVNWLNQHNNSGYTKVQFGTEAFFDKMMEKYGVKNSANIPGVQDKKENTCIEKYGFKCSLQNEDVKAKRSITWEINHGEFGGFPMQNPLIKEKLKNTSMATYGYDNPMKNPQLILERMENTFIKYGVYHTTQLESTKQACKDTITKLYGVDNISKTPERKLEMSVLFTGSTTYNDGITEHRVLIGEVPDPSWIKGSLPRRKRTKEENDKNRDQRLGSKLYNDGIRNHQVQLGQIPDPSWVIGKIQKPKSTKNNANFGSKVYNNSIVAVNIKPGEQIPEGFTPGMLPRKSKNKPRL